MLHSPSRVCVGHVAALWRYPIKSFAGETLSVAEVGWQGLSGDRRWAFVREGQTGNGFPWLTLRDSGTLARYLPIWVDPDRPDKSPLRVHTPGGEVLEVEDPRLGAQLWPRGTYPIKHDRGLFDTFPLSLVSLQSLRSLQQCCGASLSVQRFRPNIVLDARPDTGYPEDAWVGRTLGIGSSRLRLDKRDGRCAVITLDPVQGTRNPEILRAVVDHRQGCVGVYGTTVAPGTLAVGDPVWLED